MTNLKIIRATLTMLAVFALGYFYGLNSSYQDQEDKLTTADTVQSEESLDFKIAKIIITRRTLEKARYEAEATVYGIELSKDNTRTRLLAYNFVEKPNSKSQPTYYLVLLREVTDLTSITHRVSKFRFSCKITAKNQINTNESVQKPIEKAQIPLGYTIRGPTFSNMNTNGETVKIINPYNQMKNNIARCKFSREQKEKVKVVAKALSNYKYVRLNGDNLVFSDFRKVSPTNLLVPSMTTEIPIFEFIMTNFPSMMSLYAYGNESFVPLYMTSLVYLLSIHPPAIADWVYEKYKSINSKKAYSRRETALYAVSSLLEEEEKEENSDGVILSSRMRRMSSRNKTRELTYEDLKDQLKW